MTQSGYRRKAVDSLLLAVASVCVLTSSVARAEEATDSKSDQVDAKKKDPPKESFAPPPKEKVGYAIGFQAGSSLLKQKVAMDVDSFVKGLNDGLSGAKGAMSQDEIQEVVVQLRRSVTHRHQMERKKIEDEQTKKGEEYRANYGKEKGVVTLPSGLQYKVLTKGKGEKPGVQDTVAVNYEGSLIDGTVFDKALDPKEPVRFGVTRVIKGWSEGLQLMSPGAKYHFVIPPELAYGSRGSGDKIPPGATLVFDVELFEVKKKEPPKKPTSEKAGKTVSPQ
ncbi:MAG: FKBP-type peptidyl-prolyl cis-trans isomerase [Myxococcales bacterium]|nr:FKBP-type peptidyl-prolyl cis-trans isomerase [Myxococcales bacterium]